MEIAQKMLIKDLLENLEKSMTTVKNLQELSLEKLNHKKSDISWSVLECLEHLNLYGYFYFPEIKKAIEKSIRQTINEQNQQTQKSANQTFQSGFWGGIFVNLIQVKNGKIKKMKTVKDKIPASSGLNHNTI